MCRDSIYAVGGGAHQDAVFARIVEASYQSVDGFDTPIYQIWGLSAIATFVRAALRQIQASVKSPGGSANVAEAKFLADVVIVLAVVSAGLLATVCGEQYTAKTTDYPAGTRTPPPSRTS